MAGNSVVSGLIYLTLELIQGFMHVLVCCKDEEDPIENEGASVDNIPPIVSLWRFFQALKDS